MILALPPPAGPSIVTPESIVLSPCLFRFWSFFSITGIGGLERHCLKFHADRVDAKAVGQAAYQSLMQQRQKSAS